jgi:hypothetical protein
MSRSLQTEMGRSSTNPSGPGAAQPSTAKPSNASRPSELAERNAMAELTNADEAKIFSAGTRIPATSRYNEVKAYEDRKDMQ